MTISLSSRRLFRHGADAFSETQVGDLIAHAVNHDIVGFMSQQLRRRSIIRALPQFRPVWCFVLKLRLCGKSVGNTVTVHIFHYKMVKGVLLPKSKPDQCWYVSGWPRPALKHKLFYIRILRVERRRQCFLTTTRRGYFGLCIMAHSAMRKFFNNFKPGISGKPMIKPRYL